MQIYLVTGNAKKLREWQGILPDDISMESTAIDLVEIQSDNPEDIVIDKAKRAYEHIGKPVVVEDVAAGLDKFGGLPGPYIKYFVKELGGDALHKIASSDAGPGTVTCTVAYYDGNSVITAKGVVHGTIVPPRGDDAFSFDVVFVPDGEIQTFAEMTAEKKNSLSHRRKAIEAFITAFHESQHQTKSDDQN